MSIGSSRARKLCLAAVAAVFSLCALKISDAKPPAPPSPPPPGTVFYTDPQTGYWNWQMKADGSGKAVALDNGNSTGTFDASYGTYGDDAARWCIQVDGGEIAAFRTPAGSTGFNARIQVTAFRPSVVPDWNVKWSNGGDAFITFTGIHYQFDENLQRNVYVASLYRVDVSAAALEVAYLNGTPFQPISVAEATLLLPNYYTEGGGGYVGISYDWSPDGTEFAWAQNGPLNIRRANGSVETFANLTVRGNLIDWAYQGSKIAARCTPTGGQEGLYWIDASNGAFGLIKANVSGNKPTAYYGPQWSPDGQHLVVTKDTWGGNGPADVKIVRLTSSGGGETVLHTRANNRQVWPTRWTSDASQ